MLFARLRREGAADDGRAIHLPAWMTAADVAELVSEHEVVEIDKRNRRRRQWVKVSSSAPNHLLDLAVYNLWLFRWLLRYRRGSG